MTFAVYFKRPGEGSDWKLDAVWHSEHSAETNAGWLARRGFDVAVHDADERLILEKKAGA